MLILVEKMKILEKKVEIKNSVNNDSVTDNYISQVPMMNNTLKK